MAMAAGTIGARGRLGRRVAACAGAAMVCVLASASIGHAATKPLAGPTTVAPGAAVRFVASGLEPGARVAVTLTVPGRGTPIPVPVHARADARGAAVIRFRFPRSLKPCPAGALCPETAWKRGQRVELDVATASADGSASGAGVVLTVR